MDYESSGPSHSVVISRPIVLTQPLASMDISHNARPIGSVNVACKFVEYDKQSRILGHEPPNSIGTNLAKQGACFRQPGLHSYR
jgi:hypothetical protein